MNRENKEKEYNLIASRLLGHVEKQTTDMADDTMKVPSKSYTDSELWQKEIDIIFKRLPILVGLSGELPEVGSYKTKEVLGIPLLFTRLKDGTARVMLNACSHRGMQVAKGEGKCDRFSCPYHAWLYGNDGGLLRVYGQNTYGDIDKASMSLKQLPTYERGGLIFAVLTPGIEVDFDGFLGGMIEDIERLGFSDWHYCGQRVIHGANWKIAYDGYLEGYHFAAAHPKTINERTYSNIMDFTAYGPHMLIGFPQRSIEKLHDVPAEDRYRMENDGYDFVRTFFPNTSIFVAPEITQIAQLIPGPTAQENTTVLHYIHRSKPETEEDSAKLEEMMNWLQSVVQEEDYNLGLKVQKGVASGAFENVTFGRNERGNQYFHKWLEYYMSGSSDPKIPVL